MSCSHEETTHHKYWMQCLKYSRITPKGVLSCATRVVGRFGPTGGDARSIGLYSELLQLPGALKQRDEPAYPVAKICEARYNKAFFSANVEVGAVGLERVPKGGGLFFHCTVLVWSKRLWTAARHLGPDAETPWLAENGSGSGLSANSKLIVATSTFRLHACRSS